MIATAIASPLITRHKEIMAILMETMTPDIHRHITIPIEITTTIIPIHILFITPTTITTTEIIPTVIHMPTSISTISRIIRITPTILTIIIITDAKAIKVGHILYTPDPSAQNQNRIIHITEDKESIYFSRTIFLHKTTA